MKQSNILMAFAFLSLCYSQTKGQNPYDAIGKKTTMLTLSHGKYPEYIAYDSIQRIGSVVLNVKRMTIVAFYDRDSINMAPEIASRWWAVDPMAHKYPSYSPYNFALNNPIYFIDPDGGTVEPAKNDKQAADLWNAFKATANEETKAKIKKLEDSKIAYIITVEMVKKDPGGKATMKDIKDNAPNQIFITIMIPKNATAEVQKQWGYNALGDEVEGATQFEEGKIGFVKYEDGYVGVTGYDYTDEVATKVASIASAKANGTSSVSSAADYETKVVNDGMTDEDWIKQYQRADGETYKKYFGDSGGLDTQLGGNQFDKSSTVQEAKTNGTIINFIYKDNGATVTGGSN